MPICLIASGDYFSSYGGGQVYVKNLVHALAQRSHACCVISIRHVPDATGSEPIRRDDAGVAVWQLDVSSMNAVGRQTLDLQAATPLCKLLKTIAPNVVHAHGWKAATATVCKELHIPCVVTAHHGGIVCPNGALMNQHDAICALPASMKNCLKCALHFVPGGDFWSPLVRFLPLNLSLRIADALHGVPNIPYISPAFKTPLSIMRKMHDISVLRNCPDRIIAPSAAIGTALARNGIPQNKIVRIPHGIPLPSWQPPKPALVNGPLRFIYVGRISYIKGIHVMLAAFLSLPPEQYELHIVGGAVTKPEKRYLGRLKREFSGVNAIWHGACDQETVMKKLADSDVMVHPAICLEIFGLTIAEALAVGRPVIASRCGGAEAQIRDEENGWLVPPNDVCALRNVITRVIVQPDLIRRLADSLNCVRSIEDHVDDLLQLYALVGATN